MNKYIIFINSKVKFYLSFLLVFIFIISYNLYNNHLAFYFDSSAYWEWGKSFVQNEDFSLLNYKFALRGYFLPLCNFFIYLFSTILHINEIMLFRIISALFFAFFITVLIPKFFSLILNKDINLVQNLLFASIVIFFWRGYFLYPLSDFFALFFVITGLYLTIMLYKKLGKDFKIINSLLCIGIGLCISISSIVRPSYQILVLPYFILLLFSFYSRRSNLRNAIVYFLCILVGLLIGYAPQLYINYYNFNIISPYVPTQIAYEANTSLFIRQINYGLTFQKYETNIGSNFLQAPVRFLDNQGMNILRRENIDSITTFEQYIRILIKYPFDFICIYFRHFFNGLDITYSTIYVENIYRNRILFSLLNYSLWFTFFSVLIKKFRNFSINSFKFKKGDTDSLFLNSFVFLILVLPSIVSIVGAVEIRFFLPFYIICYAVICYYVPWSNIRQRLRSTSLLGWITFLLFIVLCFTMSASTFSNLQNAIMLLGNK